MTRSHDLWHVLSTLKRTITKSTLHMVWRYCILVRTPSTYCAGCTCDFNSQQQWRQCLWQRRQSQWQRRQSERVNNNDDDTYDGENRVSDDGDEVKVDDEDNTYDREDQVGDDGDEVKKEPSIMMTTPMTEEIKSVMMATKWNQSHRQQRWQQQQQQGKG